MQALLLSAHILVLGVLGWGAYEYFRLRRRAGMVASKLRMIAEKMDCDELVDQLLKEETVPAAETQAVPARDSADAKRRERLEALAAGGGVAG